MAKITGKLFLGKIAYSGKSKTNAVYVTLELREKEDVICYETGNKINGIELAICGEIWNSKKTDCYSCGQNLDDISEYIKTKECKRIREIWKEYHLNDMNAGTKKQTDAVNEWISRGNKYEYSAVCEYLKSINLYEDGFYSYGTKWLFRTIPANIIEEIKELFKISN